MTKKAYKNREIEIKRTDKNEQLYIDGKHIETIKEPSGLYIIAPYAYSPNKSLEDLAKQFIDYKDTLVKKKKDAM